MSGEIGGVGGSTELIQGLFDHPDALFEDEHLFFLPSFGDNQLPNFTQLAPDESMQKPLIKALTQLLVDNALASCSAIMRRHLESNPELIHDGMASEAAALLKELKNMLPELLKTIRKEIQELRQSPMPNREQVEKALVMYDRIRSMTVAQLGEFTKQINDVKGSDHFKEIRQMSVVEYEEMKANTLDAIDQRPILLALKEEDLPGYIIENVLSKRFKNQQCDVVSLQVNILHLPPEAPTAAIEQGKKIVGGCGMTLKPMQVISSLKGEAILQEHGSVIQQLEPEKWVKIGKDNENELQGSVFKLMFEDLPPEMDEDYSWVEELCSISDQKTLELSLLMQQFDEAIREDDKERFTKLVQAHSDKLYRMRNNSGAMLMHLAAKQKNPFYIKKLIEKGLSVQAQDKKKYLPIHYAAMHGNEEVVTLLLNSHSSINAMSNNKSTPLIVAIQHGQESVVRLLLSQKAVYNTLTSEGYTPLHSALHHGHEGITIILLDQPGIDVNKTTEEGVTPLMLACDIDSEKLVRLLLNKGANSAAARKDGVIALDIAVKKNCFRICEILFSFSHLSDFTIETAIKESSLDILKLLSTKPNFLTYRNYAKDTPLILAIRFGNIPAALHILSLIQNATDLNAENVFKETAVSLSVACGFAELTEAMIKKGALADPKQLLKDLCRAGNSSFLEDYISRQILSANDLQELLLAAAEAGQHTVISMLLTPKQVDLNALHSPKGWKIEHYLAKSDGIFLLKQRILKTKDLLSRLVNEGSKTLAYLAAENGSWNCFKFLLDQMIRNKISLDNHYQTRHLAYAVIERGDLNALRLMYNRDPSFIHHDLDGKGTSTAHLAAKIGSKAILKFLHSQGVNCDKEDADGKTPLYYAVQCSDKGAVKFLLSDTCRAKATSEVIYLAFSENVKEVLDLILQADSNLDIKSHHTQDTPLLLAVKNYDYEVFSELLKRGAKFDCINVEGWTPTLLASDRGQHDILEAILRQGYADQRTYKGNNALHLACKNGHSECVRLLISSGFSADKPNQKNQLPKVLAQHSKGALAVLGVKEKDYPVFITQLTDALNYGKLDVIEKMLKFLPINEMISIQWKGEKISGTLLHLILRLMGRSSHIQPIVDILLQDQQLNLQICDSKGFAYAHLFVMAEMQPKNLTLNVVDRFGATPLHYAAARCGETFLVKLFATSDAKKVINAPDKQGMTPLFYAIKAKKMENIEFLLNQGANPNQRNDNLYTPLLIACQKELFPVVRQLIQAGADVNMRGTIEHLTPLFISLANESDEISLYLIMKGADCRARTRDGSTIAHASAQSGKINVLRFLSNKGISLNESNVKGTHPIHVAAQYGQNEVLELLLAEDISLETAVTPHFGDTKLHKGLPAIQNARPIHFASIGGRVETVHWLLNHHVNPETKINDHQGVLCSAAQANCTSLIEMFKQYQLSQDPNQVFPAISAAIQRDYGNSVAVLYQLGIPINADIMNGWTGLHQACKLGSMHATCTLLNQGANPAIVNKEGQTALELAASNHSVNQFWQMLVRTQPDFDTVNGKGETLLHIAVRAGNLAHVMLLIDYGTSLDIQDHAGETPLHAAVKKKRLDIIGLLIGCGADDTKKTFFSEKTARELTDQASIIELIDRYRMIKAAARKHETLLHFAIKAKIIEAVKVLCFDVDINQRVSGGETALHMAAEAESIPMIRFLLSKGANIEAQDDLGYTPLWKASLNGNVLLTHVLIKAGANKVHQNKAGKSILQVLNGMNFQGKEQMVKLFKGQ